VNQPTRFLAPLALLLALVLPSPAHGENIVVQGTTDVRDAGLLDDVIVPGFEDANPGDSLTYVAVGSGQAITNAKAGQGDTLLVHAPSLEKPFVDQGYSLEPFGRAIFYSDYVIAGATSDPAGVLAIAQHDAVTAYEKIAAAGEAGDAEFISRGDASGTNTQEKLIWQLTNMPLNAAHEPAGPGGTGNPAWYHKTGTGQADTLQVANQCTFPSGACYDMTDRGTYNRLEDEDAISGLKIVAQRNSDGARGRKNLLTNPFTAYAVDPDKVAGANADGARKFLDFLTSRSFQKRLARYPSAGSPAFVADARPSVKSSGTPDRPVYPKHHVVLRAKVSSLLPGVPAPKGAKVSLERSFKAGPQTTTQRIIRTAKTDGKGKVTFRFPASRTSRYRLLTTPIQPDLSVTPLIGSGQLSPSAHNVGRVQVKHAHKH
jgi:tungstate transport system substrate-binding protein